MRRIELKHKNQVQIYVKEIGCKWNLFISCSQCELNRTMFECNMFLNENGLKKTYGYKQNLEKLITF